jgi:hypothetical protein
MLSISYVWLNRTKTIQQYLRREGSIFLCNGNVPDASSPINFKNNSFCLTSSRDFNDILSNKSIMSLISIDSQSHWGISFPERQHTSF